MKNKRIWRPPVPFKWRGNHHSYYGVFFIVFALFNLYMGFNNLEELFPLWYTIMGLGVFMFVDDWIEHNLTADTPLHIIWEWLYRRIKK